MLVEPEIAANTGAVGRTCVAVGATLWLVRPLGFIISDSKLRRAGLDYWDQLDLRLVDHIDEVAAALGGTARLWLFSTKASTPHVEVVYRAGDALIFGSEGRGLPEHWLADRPDRGVRIPIRPEARSLNLSVSVAVGLFEATRQIGLAAQTTAPPNPRGPWRGG